MFTTFATSSQLIANMFFPPHSLFCGQFPLCPGVYHNFLSFGVDLRKLYGFAFKLHFALCIPYKNPPCALVDFHNAGEIFQFFVVNLPFSARAGGG